MAKAREAADKALVRRDLDRHLRAGLSTAALLANADERIALVRSADVADDER
jgi:hypothetical protein